MVGFPWEKRKDIEETIKFIKESRVDMPQVKTLVPYNGTKIREQCEKNNLIEQSPYFGIPETFSDSKFIAKTKYLSTQQLANIYKNIYLNIYTPLKSLKILTKLMRNRAWYGIRYYILNSIRFLYYTYFRSN